MFKKDKGGDNSGNSKAVQKRKYKIGRVQIGDFLVVSLYDLITWVGIALCVGLVLIYGFQGNQRGVFWSGLALFILVLVMLAIRAKQHFFGESTHRPELFVEQVEFETFEVGQPEVVSLRFRNRGKITARNVAIETTFAHKLASFEGRLVYKTVPSDTHSDVGPDAVMTQVSRSPWITTAEYFRDVMEGDHLLFHYGRGHYEDDRGNRYPISFCFMFEPAFPRNMVIAPDRYWPTDEKEGKNADNPNQ